MYTTPSNLNLFIITLRFFLYTCLFPLQNFLLSRLSIINYHIVKDVKDELDCDEISRAFSKQRKTRSMDGLCCFGPMHDKASFSVMLNASPEYSPLSLGSANSDISPPLAKFLA